MAKRKPHKRIARRGKLGKHLRNLRITRGIKQKEAAKVGCMAAPYLNQVERGSRTSPHPTKLQKLAELYDADFVEILRIGQYIPTPKGYGDDWSNCDPTKFQAVKRAIPDLLSDASFKNWYTLWLEYIKNAFVIITEETDEVEQDYERVARRLKCQTNEDRKKLMEVPLVLKALLSVLLDDLEEFVGGREALDRDLTNNYILRANGLWFQSLLTNFKSRPGGKITFPVTEEESLKYTAAYAPRILLSNLKWKQAQENEQGEPAQDFVQDSGQESKQP